MRLDYGDEILGGSIADLNVAYSSHVTKLKLILAEITCSG